MEEFVLPEFLQGTEESLHDEMIRMAPPNTDTAEGSLYWDNTIPTAMIADRLISYELTMSLMMKFPQFAVGPFLDWHGDPVGVYRRMAVSAVGEVTFTGAEGTVIPSGTIVTTIGDENEESLLFEVMESGEIGELGSIVLSIRAVEPGVVGIVPDNSIVGVTEPIKGLTRITNNLPTEGGAEAEGDDSLRERILDRNRNKPLSGAKNDYKRWAKEVPGVGNAIILPLWDGDGTVKVLITDTENKLATSELIQSVKTYIDPVDGMGEGVAPIGSTVTVDTLTPVLLILKLNLQIKDGYELEDVEESIKLNINDYLSDKTSVRYMKLNAIITNTNGVQDHNGLLVNGTENNIILQVDERAFVGAIEVMSFVS